MMSSDKPVITFDSYRVTNLTFKSVTDKEEYEDNKTVSKVNAEFGLTKDLKHGMAKQIVDFSRDETQQIVHLEVIGQFTVQDQEADSDKVKSYIAMNGNAMLYPYLRAIISIVTSIDRPDTTILPTLNFKTTVEELTSEKNEDSK